MGIGKGGKGAGTTRATALSSQTQVLGTVVPLLYGRGRLTPKLAWNQDFKATPVSSGKKGGKAGQQYDYSTAADWVLGHYPIQQVLSCWRDKDYLPVGYAGGTFTVANNQVNIASAIGSGQHLLAPVGCHVWQSGSASFNDYGGDGPVTISKTWDIPLWNEHYYTPDGQAGSVRRPFTYSWKPSDGSTIHFPDNALNGCQVMIKWAWVTQNSNAAMGIFASVFPVSDGPLGVMNLEFERYLASGSEYANHLDQRIPYNWVSGIGSVKFDLGAANMIPAFSLEARGACDIWALGGCDPADIIIDLVAGVTLCADDNPFPGVTLMSSGGPGPVAGYPVSVPHSVNSAATTSLPITLGDLGPMRAWCRANGISCSLYLNSQRSAKDILDELFAVANCAPVWSGSVLNAIPYDEVSSADHGLSYTAPTASGPVCDLDDNCFLVDGNTPPISIDRSRQADANNVVKITHTNDGQDLNAVIQQQECAYNDTTTTEIEQRSVAQYGARPASARDMHSITKPSIAQKIASVLVKRAAMQRNSYKFSLPVSYCWLEAMDLVTVSDSYLGLVKAPVRLTSVEESWDESKGWTLACEAEDFIYGLNHPTPMELQSANPYTSPSNVDPGDVNAPVFMELPDAVNSGPGNWLHIALSGASADWGGCVVWVSTDGTTYEEAGIFTGKSTMGKINSSPAPSGAPGNWATGAWGVTADPDTSSGFWVDLTESDGSLASATQADADAFKTLCWVDGELVAYSEIDLVTNNAYCFSAPPYLRRGLYSTPISSHDANSPFVRLDDNVFALRLDPKWVNSGTGFPKELYFKFTSFNSQGGGAQSLEQVSEYSWNYQGHYNNFLQIIGNDSFATFGNNNGSTCDIWCFGNPNGTATAGALPSPAPDISYVRSDGRTWTSSYMGFGGVPLATTCWFMWHPVEGNYYLTDYGQVMIDCHNGAYCVNVVRTPSAGGTGGSSSSSGGGGFGGAGGHGSYGGKNPL